MMQPKLTILKVWAASLFVDFPEDDIPRLSDEEKWKDWASVLVQCTSFVEAAAPWPSDYKDWNTWADDVFKAMENF